jgi:HlyD family secretion protein
VELDPALFKNAVTVADAGLVQARADYASAQATAKGARIIHDRAMNLGRQLLLSRADLDAATATFNMTEGLAQAGAAQVATAQGQLQRAKLDLAHSIIRSPVDGTVISRNIDVGQAVASSLTAPTLFTIAQDLRKMQVHAAVDEADIGQVRAGQAATFTVDAFRGETFKAVVNEVRNSPQTAQNVVTYDVVIDVDNPDEKLRPGMTANVLILIVQKNQVVAVSNEALRFRPAGGKGTADTARTADGMLGGAVYVPDGARAVRVPVRTGITDGNMTEVEGLEPGRLVIIDAPAAKGKAGKAGGSIRGI